MNFLADRTPRERGLVALAAALLILVLGWFVIVSPVLDAKAEARAEQQRAIRDYGLVMQALPQLGSGAREDRGPFSRNAVIDTARQSNLPISRVQPLEADAVKIWVEDGTSASLFYFLSSLTREFNAVISDVQITRRDGGVVSAQVTLRPA